MASIGKAYILMYFSNIKKSLTKHYIFLQLSKDLDRVDKERKEGLQKIQAMHSEIKDLKVKLSDFELNKTKDIKKLQDSLTESLKSNKKVQEPLILWNRHLYLCTKDITQVGKGSSEEKKVQQIPTSQFVMGIFK